MRIVFPDGISSHGRIHFCPSSPFLSSIQNRSLFPWHFNLYVHVMHTNNWTLKSYALITFSMTPTLVLHEIPRASNQPTNGTQSVLVCLYDLCVYYFVAHFKRWTINNGKSKAFAVASNALNFIRSRIVEFETRQERKKEKKSINDFWFGNDVVVPFKKLARRQFDLPIKHTPHTSTAITKLRCGLSSSGSAL